MSRISLTIVVGVMPCSAVVRRLDGAAAVGLIDRHLHRLGHPVRVHDDLATDVASGPADDLDERPGAAQEALLVRVQDGHQRDLGQVDALAQQVDADEHVVDAKAQIAQDLDALQRVHLTVQVRDAHAHLVEVVGEVLGHALGERGHQHPLATVHALLDAVDEVIDLALRGPHLDDRIHDAGGPDELLHDRLRSLQLPRPGRGAHVHDLVEVLLELLEA